jgi:hypothetical protein
LQKGLLIPINLITMKKLYTTLVAVIAIFHFSYGQWTTGTDISNTNSGKVGIGTTSPSYKLEINGNLGGKGGMGNGSTAQYYEMIPYEIATDNNAGWAGTLIGVRSGGLNNTSTPITQNIAANAPQYQQAWAMTFGTDKYQTNGSALSIWTGDASVAATPMSELFRINSNGNVGIGTISPSSKLSINGSSGDIAAVQGDYTGNIGISVQNTSSGNPQYRFLNSSGTEKAAITLVNSQEIGGHGTLYFYDGVVNLMNLYNGNVGIGTTIPDAKLAVNGTIHTKEVKVDLNVPGPDYVFNDGYKLITLTEIKDYVTKNHHLPEIPSAAQMAKEGINLGDMNTKLLKKVEELTLYAIDQQKQIEELKQKQDTRIATLEAALTRLTTCAESK